MDNLPTTYQGMKDYVRFAKNHIRKETKRIAELKEIINTLEPRIRDIDKQLKEEGKAT